MAEEHIEVIVRGAAVVDGCLLLCHTKGAGNTYLPGGHIDFGEDARSALTREIDEEMGLAATVTRFLGVVEHEFDQNGEKHHEVNLVFAMEIDGLDSAQSPVSSEDYIEFSLVDIGELKNSRLEPSPLRQKLQDWLEEPQGEQFCSTLHSESH